MVHCCLVDVLWSYKRNIIIYSTVEVKVKGFQQYIKKFKAIEKEQEKIFDTKFKDTQLSFDQVVNCLWLNN